METKYFKKIYADREALGIWKTGDGVNYTAGENHTVEFITKTVYDGIVKSKEPDILRDEKLALLGQEFAVKFNQGFEHDGHTFGCTFNDNVYWLSFKSDISEYDYPLHEEVKDITGAYYTVKTIEDAREIVKVGKAYVNSLRKEFSEKEALIKVP